ncbi:2-oxoglutarate (2OG) and Fe(II)-dependent oxygenase superfamily protein [Actinidia rufa]|uniref:2-oxoglutarate (2OG) and Fe(II)-dependent oxygenase superfamily protein n=1 Tax=Actinidia rufa TaxID=165716 RepID=A0A7J0ED32_9ERIC|nr:2-oxoglutarate (2OG) and Fe(II)-dependent oxygenase superfamily protein [Actinidia rufa]
MGERRREGDGRTAKMEWPPIKPKSNLSFTRLKDTDIFTVQNFFTSVESKAFINAAESIGFVHQGGLGPTKGEAYRDNDRISVNDPVLAAKSRNDKGVRQDSSETIVGGETVFYGPRNGLVAEVTPTEGMALLHIHGDKCMEAGILLRV